MQRGRIEFKGGAADSQADRRFPSAGEFLPPPIPTPLPVCQLCDRQTFDRDDYGPLCCCCSGECERIGGKCDR